MTHTPQDSGQNKSCLGANLDEIYYSALYIREFELNLLKLFEQGHLSGTVHTCVGQELTPAILGQLIDIQRDGLFATHRGHGFFLGSHCPPKLLLHELLSKEGAACNGRGGSQHVHYKNFFSNGIQGASAIQAVGFAWAKRNLLGDDSICVVQLGDGTFGEGALYEAFNFAALLHAPVLFIAELNGWAQSTDVKTTTAGSFEKRAEAFGLEYNKISDSDAEKLYDQLVVAVQTVRKGTPFVQFIETRRLLAHSKGDDNRPADYIKQIWVEDALKFIEPPEATAKDYLLRVKSEIEELTANALDSKSASEPAPSAIAPLRQQINAENLFPNDRSCSQTILTQLNTCLHDVLSSNKDSFVIGEDIADPYGGAFKVTKGLSSKFKNQTISTPISESAIVGFSIGGALFGGKFIAEIMFADFITLGIDQLINSAAKMHFMYNEQIKIPITVRLVSGGGRGYGPTHSQSTERMLAGEPGLRVIALSHLHNPYELLRHTIIDDPGPSIFVESKKLYGKHPKTTPSSFYKGQAIDLGENSFPSLHFTPIGFEASLTIVCYGEGALLADEALEWLAIEHELFAELVVITQISSMNLYFLKELVRKTSKLLIIDQSHSDYGFSTTVKSKVIDDVFSNVRCRTVCQADLPIPSSINFEAQVLPNITNVMNQINELIGAD